jgi:hypothetical protein
MVQHEVTGTAAGRRWRGRFCGLEGEDCLREKRGKRPASNWETRQARDATKMLRPKPEGAATSKENAEEAQEGILLISCSD